MNDRFALAVACVLLSSGVVACGGPDWPGTYKTTGHWNLSGPLADGRSAGDAVADLLIDQVASKAPLPSGPKEDLAIELNALFRPKLRMLIDERAPEELRAGGAITNLLATSLANVKVESTLELEGDDDEVEGTETFVAFEVTDGNGTGRFVPSELGQTEILAEWEGEVDDGTFTIEQHEVGIQFGALVKLVAARVIAEPEIASLSSGVLAALDCPALVTGMLDGRNEIEIDLGLASFTIDRETLTDGCMELRSLVEGQALGLFAFGTGVEIGGPVTYTQPEDAEVEKVVLKHGTGFGGILAVVPEPIAPKVFVAFEAIHD